jgi:hypothetical protein
MPNPLLTYTLNLGGPLDLSLSSCSSNSLLRQPRNICTDDMGKFRFQICQIFLPPAQEILSENHKPSLGIQPQARRMARQLT